MTLLTPSWLRRHWKPLTGLVLLLATGGAAIGVLAWKHCADTAAKNQPIADPAKKHPNIVKDNPAAAATKEPKQLLSRYSLLVNALAFSPDGLRLATAGSNPRPQKEVRLWDLITDREERGFQDFAGIVFSLAFSPDGKTLASGGQGSRERSGTKDQATGQLKLWNLDRDAKPSLWRKTDSHVVSVAFSPQGGRLAAGCEDGSLALYNRATGKPELSLHTESSLIGFTNVAFSADGKKIAWGGVASSGGPTPHLRGVLQVWDAVSGKSLATLHPPESRPNIPNTKNVAFLAGGDKLVSSSNQTIYIWDLNSGQVEAALNGHQGIIDALALSPDGQLLASADGYACIKLWQTSTRREKATLRGPTIVVQGSPRQQDLKQGRTVALAFDPEGEILASSTLYMTENDQQGVVQLWDLVSLKEVKLLH